MKPACIATTTGREENKMRRLTALVVFSLSLLLTGLAMAETPMPAVQQGQATVQAATPLVRCSTCGVEFTTLKGLQEHLIAHPGHKIVPAAGGVAAPLVKCSTCGAEFTTISEIQEHLKAHPEHKLVSTGGVAAPLVKCSTCGVEFTNLQEVQEHLRAHPEHQVVPVE